MYGDIMATSSKPKLRRLSSKGSNRQQQQPKVNSDTVEGKNNTVPSVQQLAAIIPQATSSSRASGQRSKERKSKTNNFQESKNGLLIRLQVVKRGEGGVLEEVAIQNIGVFKEHRK